MSLHPSTIESQWGSPSPQETCGGGRIWLSWGGQASTRIPAGGRSPLLPLPLLTLVLATLIREGTGGGRERLADGFEDFHLGDSLVFHNTYYLAYPLTLCKFIFNFLFGLFHCV